MEKVNLERARLGAAQSRLESAATTQQISHENNSAAKSRIYDADYAKQTSELARTLILKNAGIASLSHSHVNSGLVSGLLNKKI